MDSKDQDLVIIIHKDRIKIGSPHDLQKTWGYRPNVALTLVQRLRRLYNVKTTLVPVCRGALYYTAMS